MPAHHSCIGHPWILALLGEYGHSETKPKAVPAQVVEFVTLKQDQVDDSDCPAAVVHISDRKHYIRAIITKEAKKELEAENQHFTLEDIKSKIIILKEFIVHFKEEEKLDDCEFYICIRRLSILPMETDTVDLMNCNADPSVKVKIVECWQKYRANLDMKDTSSSDACLSQLLDIVNEEKLNNLRNAAEECLNLRGIIQQSFLHRSTSTWKTGNKSKEMDNRVFYVPMNWLIISPEEEEVLNNLEEWRDEFIVMNDKEEPESFQGDIWTARRLSNESRVTTQVNPFTPSPNEEVGNENKATQSLNAWNKMLSDCCSIISSSGGTPETLSNPLTSPASHKTFGTEEDGVTQPDSSTPDVLENIDGSLQASMDISPPLLFCDSNKHDEEPFDDPHAIMCKTVTSIGSTGCVVSDFACGQKPNHVINDIINSSQVSCSLPSHMSSFPNIDCMQGSQNEIPVDNQVKIISQNLYSGMDNSLLENSDSDIIRSDEEGQIGEKSLGQCIKQKTTKRKQPMELLTKTYFFEKEHEAEVQSYAEKKPKMKGFQPHQGGDMNIRAMSYKPELQFINDQEIVATKAANPTTDSALVNARKPDCVENLLDVQTGILKYEQERLNSELPNQVLQRTKNMRHRDGSCLQYKYKTPESDLCTRIRAAQLSRRLLEWAFHVILRKQQRL